MEDKFITLVIIVILIILSEAIAQSCLKKYNMGKNMNYLLGGCVFYLCVIFLLCKSYNYDNMYGINLYWSIGSIVTILLFDMVLFHAEIMKEDIMGIMLCIIGLYFIFVFGHNRS